MASFKEHVADCVSELGAGYPNIHHWLDEYARIYRDGEGNIWMGHRIHRHHREGVEEVRRMWGDLAARAAEIHILKDENAILSKDDIERKYGVFPREETLSIR